jgi:lysozyme
MDISYMLLDKLKEFEGLRLEAYRCAGGKLTIGYGHTGSDVREGDKISQYWAEELLKADVAKVAEQVQRMGVAHTQGQFDALVSFAFNIGVERLRTSKLLRLIRRQDSYRNIKAEFKRWVFAGGRKLAGLERRREWEACRFFSPSPSLPVGAREGNEK